MIQLQLRNNCAKHWKVKTFDFFPYVRVLKSKNETEVEIGWLCFAIAFIKMH